jgi:hypothetical protein
MSSTRQITAVTIVLALAGCSERRLTTGKPPEHVPREHFDVAQAEKPKPDLAASYERRQTEELVRGAEVEQATPTEPRIGVAGTHLFHRPDCAAIKGVPASEQIRFTSQFDAVDAGYTPCHACDPMH